MRKAIKIGQLFLHVRYINLRRKKVVGGLGGSVKLINMYVYRCGGLGVAFNISQPVFGGTYCRLVLSITP